MLFKLQVLRRIPDLDKFDFQFYELSITLYWLTSIYTRINQFTS